MTDSQEGFSIEKAVAVRSKLRELFSEVGCMEIDLSDDTSFYTADYIREKLARVSSLCERIADIQCEIIPLKLLSRAAFETLKVDLTYEKAKFKASEEYEIISRDKREFWLVGKVSTISKLYNEWYDTVSEAKIVIDAIKEKGSAYKRIDSDLRLHAKILSSTVISSPSGTTENLTFDI
jgi:hypothetical protein